MRSETRKSGHHLNRATPAAVAIAFLVAAALAAPARAGPPFLTDDPEPVDLGHWEVYGFSTVVHAAGDTNGILGGVEVNYGAAPNLQLHIIVPAAFDQPDGGPLTTGIGDVELGVKYRFIDQDKAGWPPDVAIFPLLELPAGDAREGLGAGEVRAYLPIWIEKDFGGWTTYGGGGYWINPGSGNQNYWFAGWLLQRQVTKTLAIGAELFHQSADRIDGPDSTGFNVGAVYDFTDHYHLLFSVGRGLQNAAATNAFSYYVGFQSTF